jgi:hypothetical protein
MVFQTPPPASGDGVSYGIKALPIGWGILALSDILMPLSDILGCLIRQNTPSYPTFLRVWPLGIKISEKRFFVTQETNKACDFTRKPC